MQGPCIPTPGAGKHKAGIAAALCKQAGRQQAGGRLEARSRLRGPRGLLHTSRSVPLRPCRSCRMKNVQGMPKVVRGAKVACLDMDLQKARLHMGVQVRSV